MSARIDVFGGIENGHHPRTDERVCSPASAVSVDARPAAGDYLTVYHLDAAVMPGVRGGGQPTMIVEPWSVMGSAWCCPACGYSTGKTTGTA